MSKYCLQNSPVPVVVVRPEEKREKKRKKRLADPGRQNYSSILDQTNASGSGAFDSLARQSAGQANETEAAAVLKAIGVSEGSGAWKDFKKAVEDGSPLTKTVSGRSDATSEAESPSPTGPLVLMDDSALEDTPEMEGLGPSALSDVNQEWEDADDEEGAEGKALDEVDPIVDLSLNEPEGTDVDKGNENRS